MEREPRPSPAQPRDKDMARSSRWQGRRLVAVELTRSGGDGAWMLRGAGGFLGLTSQKGGRKMKVFSLGSVNLAERRARSDVQANSERWDEKSCLGHD